MLYAFGHPFATCYALLGVVGSNLKLVKFFTQHLWMSHDVVVCPGSRNIPGHAHQFNFQLATCRNTSKHGGQTYATCCAQQYWDMLRCNVAIVWPGLENTGPTMLRYIALNVLHTAALTKQPYIWPDAYYAMNSKCRGKTKPKSNKTAYLQQSNNNNNNSNSKNIV